MDSSTINVLIETDSIPKKDGYHIKIENSKFQKMLFVFNAINDGWCIKKRKDSYIFSKNHEGKKEVFLDSYLQTFMTSNLNLNTLLQ